MQLVICRKIAEEEKILKIMNSNISFSFKINKKLFIYFYNYFNMVFKFNDQNN